MRKTIFLLLISMTVLLAGCSRGDGDHDGQYITDADGQRFLPRIPFKNSFVTSEAQKLMDDFVAKHRADGAIKGIKVESAEVDASYTGILNGGFAFSGQATVTIAGSKPFTVGFHERIAGSLMPNDHRLLDHWSFADRSWSSITSAYVLGLDSWRASLASETDVDNVGYRVAQALSLTNLVIDLKDRADAGALDAWKKANAIAWDRRTEINLPLMQ